MTRPDFSRCYGITHSPEGLPIVREPKLLKVGIGIPKGRGIHVYMTVDKSDRQVWCVAVGTNKDNTKREAFNKRADAEAFYFDKIKSAPERKHPVKLPYFTFSRMTGDGAMVADFDAIEAHGVMPQEIDIVFLSDSPLEAAYAMWSTAELRCKGDGLNAMRIASMATTADEKASIDGKYFPIVDGCATKGCRYATGEPPPCKPSGDLKFQLANNLRVGGTAYFHTTGYRSISQMFSALHVFRTLTGGGDPDMGRIAGIPFRFVVRPYQTKHNGQVATQYGVSLEFRAETVAALRTRMIEQASEFRAMVGPGTPTRQIAAPGDDNGIIDEDMGDESAQAAALNSEFMTATDGDEPESKPDPVITQTEAAKEALKARMRSRQAKPAVVTPEPEVIEAPASMAAEAPLEPPDMELF